MANCPKCGNKFYPISAKVHSWEPPAIKCPICGYREEILQRVSKEHPAGFDEDGRKTNFKNIIKCGACNSSMKASSEHGICGQCVSKVKGWLKSPTNRGLQVPVEAIKGKLLVEVKLKLAAREAA